MATIKLTTWNIEHLSKLLPDTPVNKKPKIKGMVDEITEIDPDILCIVEGPGNLTALRAWVNSPEGLGGRYHVATIPGTEEALAQDPSDPRKALMDLYQMQGTKNTGNQWIWFLVRDGLFQEANARILNPDVWRNLTGQKNWPVHKWGKYKASRRSHWRHPQTLILQLGGVEVEIIGVHLKSKINKKKAFDDQGKMLGTYVDEALRARVYLATEAFDVRRYIERRFEQVANPRILVCGDMNDGPGRKYFEREYLYFDLVSNIQGDVFFARRFLNHALFDFDETIRWSTQFKDKIEVWARQQPGSGALPAEPIDVAQYQLLDHILFTQALVGESASPRVSEHSGLVEHTIHQRINALLTKANRTSDHVPVSVRIEV